MLILILGLRRGQGNQRRHRETQTPSSTAASRLPDLCVTALKLRAEHQALRDGFGDGSVPRDGRLEVTQARLVLSNSRHRWLVSRRASRAGWRYLVLLVGRHGRCCTSLLHAARKLTWDHALKFRRRQPGRSGLGDEFDVREVRMANGSAWFALAGALGGVALTGVTTVMQNAYVDLTITCGAQVRRFADHYHTKLYELRPVAQAAEKDNWSSLNKVQRQARKDLRDAMRAELGVLD